MQKDNEPGTGYRGPKGPKFCPQTQIKEEAYAINKITTVSSNKEELSIWYGHSPWQPPSLGEVPRYRITITTPIFTVFLSSILLVVF